MIKYKSSRVQIFMVMLLSVLLCSCEDYTDIQPKGKNLLSTVDELELLLNAKSNLSTYLVREMGNDIVYYTASFAALRDRSDTVAAHARIFFREDACDARAKNTTTDSNFTDWYEIIGQICNPVLQQVDAASGEQWKKDQLKAEALVLRAYCHWLLVNKFAAAYNPSTAANTPGIPYSLEDWDILELHEKNTVKEVYDLIVKDCDAAIALNALPVTAVNRMRMCKSGAYAVKAMALMCMQDFDGAEAAAKEAIAANGTIVDYNTMLGTHVGAIKGITYQVLWRPRGTCEEDYFFTANSELYNAIVTEAWNYFEPGHVCKEKLCTDSLHFDYTRNYSISNGMAWIHTWDQSRGTNAVGIKSTYMYLLIAECEINKGNINEAMRYLDMIRVKRIDPSIYQPLQGRITTEADAILYLKKTSHGEGFLTLWNFLQKKRWNELDKYKQAWGRMILGEWYEIKPGSPLWIFPFPSNAVSNNPKLLPQNYRVAMGKE